MVKRGIKFRKSLLLAIILLLIVFGAVFVRQQYYDRFISKFFSLNASVDQASIPSDKVGVFGVVDLEAAKELGIKWTRIPISWTAWDQYKTQGAKTPALKALDLVKSSGLNVVVTLTSQQSTKTQCTNPDAQGIADCPPKDLNQYKQFITSIVSEYKSPNIIWQLGNEVYRSPLALKFWDGPFDDPNKIDFLDIYQAGIEAVKGVDPTAKIAAPGINFGKMDFSTAGEPQPNANAEEQQKWTNSAQNFEKLVKKYCDRTDYFDDHLYHTIDSIEGRIKWTKNILSTNDCNKKIISTEIAGPNPPPGTTEYQKMLTDNDYFEQAQASELPLRITKAHEQGLEAIIWFYFKDIGSTGANGIKLLGKFGLIANNNRKKPAFDVLKKLINTSSTDEEVDIYALDPEKTGVFGLPDDSAAYDLGVKWTRIPGLDWLAYDKSTSDVINRYSGFTNTSVIATLKAKNGAKTTCAIDPEDYINDVLGSKDKAGIPAGTNLNDIVSCLPKDIDSVAPGSYKDFVKNVVTDLGESVDAYQIENEVYSSYTSNWLGDKKGEFENFIKLFKVAASQVKATNPTKKVLAPGIALGRIEFSEDGVAQPSIQSSKDYMATIEKNIKLFLTQDCSSIDIVDIHLFHTVEDIPARVKWLKKIMTDAACVKPIWSTEISGPDPTAISSIDSAQFAKAQADEISLRLNTALENGIEKVIYFLHKDNPAGNSKTANLGLLDKDNNKKLAYFALQNSITKFVGSNKQNSELRISGLVSESLLPGKSITQDFNIKADNSERVTLTVSGDGNGLETKINPSNCVTDCVATLTVSARDSAPLGQSTLTVSATGASVASSASTTITIVPPPDETPPRITSSSPDGELGSDTTQVNILANTNEQSECRIGRGANTVFANITQKMESSDLLKHTILVTSLNSDTLYTYYIRCEDESGNENISDYKVEFKIAKTEQKIEEKNENPPPASIPQTENNPQPKSNPQPEKKSISYYQPPKSSSNKKTSPKTTTTKKKTTPVKPTDNSTTLNSSTNSVDNQNPDPASNDFPGLQLEGQDETDITNNDSGESTLPTDESLAPDQELNIDETEQNEINTDGSSKKTNNTALVVISIIIVLGIVAGGVIFFRKIKENQNEA